MGFSGVPTQLPLTKPCQVKVAGQMLKHSFLVSPQTPVNILGRDLLLQMGVMILCDEKGIALRFPNGQQHSCSENALFSGTQCLLGAIDESAEQQDTSDIYWGLIQPENQAVRPSVGLYSLYLQWKPWLNMLASYVPPPDPLHCIFCKNTCD
ncbi:hypothetical protein Q8A73_005794 [Channa argus]|nr:hypothetical protein Q8A73_005794 [Channa argus]